MHSHFDKLQSLAFADEGEQIYTPPYILCNEQFQREMITTIEQRFGEGDSGAASLADLHVGFSVWFNLDLLSVLNASYALIFDIDPSVGLIYDKIRNAFQALTPQTFMETFLKDLCEDERDLMPYPMDCLKYFFDAALQRDFGFLSSIEKYNKVKAMIDAQRIYFGCADLTNVKHMQAILTWSNEHNCQIKTLYLSNIPEWILENKSKNIGDEMISNIKHLINANTFIIDAFYPTSEKKNSGPPLRLSVGELSNYKKVRFKSAATSCLFNPPAAAQAPEIEAEPNKLLVQNYHTNHKKT